MKKKNQAILLSLAVFFWGCVSHPAANIKETGAKHITDILAVKTSESLIFTIKSNHSLTYTVKKLKFPMGVLLHFSQTRLDLAGSLYTPPENEIISSVKARQIIEGKTISVSILFALKRESPYFLTEDDAAIKITFPISAPVSDVKLQKEWPANTAPAGTIENDLSAPNYLKRVTATPLENHIAIEVEADRSIKNFESFTLENPDRIIFDLFNFKSPYDSEQIMAVDSQWVKRIRHFAHPDRLRIVIETHENYLLRYSAVPTNNGLLIRVGELPHSSTQELQMIPYDSPETGQVTLVWDEVPDATSYNVYWRASPGVNRHNGSKISDIKKPKVTIKGLSPGTTYYFVVTTVKGTMESKESEELSFSAK
jgi:hypothetical protein